MHKKWIGLCWILFCLPSYAAGQTKLEHPGSSGWGGERPYWISAGFGHRTKTYELERFLFYRKEQGSPKTSFEGYDYNFSIGLSLFSYFDLSLEYAQTPTLMVRGKKGDQFGYLYSHTIQTYTFSEDRKIKFVSYQITSLNGFFAVTDGPVRVYAGFSMRTVDPKLYFKPEIADSDPSFSSYDLRAGIGRFFGNYFPYFELSSISTFGLRYYF